MKRKRGYMYTDPKKIQWNMLSFRGPLLASSEPTRAESSKSVRRNGGAVLPELFSI